MVGNNLPPVYFLPKTLWTDLFRAEVRSLLFLAQVILMPAFFGACLFGAFKFGTSMVCLASVLFFFSLH